MNFNFLSYFESNSKHKPHILYAKLFLCASLFMIYLLVYVTGGIKYVFSHSMYVPIVLSGLLFGYKFGVFVAVIAGVLLGPLMPIDTLTGEVQLWYNWIYRLLVFVFIGYIIGYSADHLRLRAKVIEALGLLNPQTQIPNINFLKKGNDILVKGPQVLVSIKIHNYEKIIEVMGTDIYFRLCHSLYQTLLDDLEEHVIVIQPELNKLWIIKQEQDTHKLAQRIRQTIDAYYEIDGIPIFIDFSLGLYQVKSIDESIDINQFKHADFAANQARSTQVDYVIFDNEHFIKKENFDLLASFKKSLERNELFLVYQAKIDLKTDKVYGLEALLRWKHPTKGYIPPMMFIPLIEGTKLIHTLTDWVLNQVCLKQKEIAKNFPDLKFSVNVSAKNLYDPFFFDRSIEIIKFHHIETSSLELEITESSVMENPSESKEILRKFADHGLLISIDDFGSGYSSLAYLTRFPVHLIKIDRYFMKDLEHTSSLQHIVKSTILLAHQLEYKVLAEGVETKACLDLLKSYGCDFAQGYFYSKPLDDENLLEYLVEGI